MSIKQSSQSRLLSLVPVCLMTFDFVSLCAAYLLALCVRFECGIGGIPGEYLRSYRSFVLYYALGSLLIYMYFGLYRSLWKFASYHELVRCVSASLVSIALHFVFISMLYRRMPLSYYLFGGMFQLGFLVTSRFFYRAARLEYLHLSKRFAAGKNYVNAMVIGAGRAGLIIIRELTTSERTMVRVCCVVDDDSSKWGRTIEDVPIIGGRDAIIEGVKRYGVRRIFFAVPTCSAEDRTQILNICKEAGCEIQALPGIYQFTNNEISLKQMRDVTVEDLLGRRPVSFDAAQVNALVNGKVVLVTGGGGTIGSEICRQLAEFGPRRIVVFDIFDDNAYRLQQDMRRRFPALDLAVVIGSVRDSSQVNELFKVHRPDIVFHAASHKNIPLAEGSPDETVKNNIFGTYKVAYAALAYGCSRFVLISTDKAVNPTSVLGACSRFCEMMLQSMSMFVADGDISTCFSPNMHARVWPELPAKPSTEFCVVRFGGALDSNGSVFHMFRQQIAVGGPVTVTHKEATRFFMNTRDIVKLLLQASSDIASGEIAVLDMGEPVSIDKLARNLIKLNGYVPDVDIPVTYIGLRPGEKLCDEALMWQEGMRKTANPDIYVANPTPIDARAVFSQLYGLFKSVAEGGCDLRARLSELVGTYEPQEGGAEAGALGAAVPFWAHEPINNLERIALRFGISGDIVSIVLINRGYINRTYRVETRERSGRSFKYILQRINSNVFPDADALMENYGLVTEHLSRNFRLPGREDACCNQMPLPTRDGKVFFSDESGAWRMLSYFDDVHSYDIPDSPRTFFYAGQAFGSFLKAIADIPSDKVHEVIPNFHNTWSRYQDLEKAISEDPYGRVADVKPEIDFIRSHRDMFRVIADALASGEIPLHICHNDCNLNNILFDNRTNMPVAIIDLDTIMPSSPLYDYGDSMRVGTNTAKDDEKDLSKVSCNLALYEQYARGWLGACGSMLTRRELELLPLACLVITSEDGIRFLADHINGDCYYNIFYPGQNLDRSRTQLRLLKDMEQKLPMIKNILNVIYGELNLGVTLS